MPEYSADADWSGFFFFQAEDGIRDSSVTGVQTCALPISDSVTELGKANSRYIEQGTLLLTNSGATLGVPKITLIGGCINDGVAALLEVGDPLKMYLLHHLSSLTESLRSINQGAAQPN